jgi:DNA-directed RNA polymerase specialized sigma24 family protein
MRRRPDQFEQVGETLVAPRIDADRADAGEDAHARTLAALQSLPARFRKILVLREVEGLAVGEVARRLGLSRGAAERRWARAIVLMAERLAEMEMERAAADRRARKLYEEASQVHKG